MKSIRSLERGLQVLKLMGEQRGYPLHEIHQSSGLPKATLLRILLTLENHGMVWRAMGDGLYRLRRGRVPKTHAEEIIHRIGEVAAIHLEQLQRKVIWPSDLLVYREMGLELVESSRRHSHLGLKNYVLGYRVDLFSSAPGRAYLAFCNARQRQRILAQAARRPPANPRSREVLVGELETILAETRRLGYGSRDARFGGSDHDIAEYDDQLDAIGVPVLSGSTVLACMNLVWPRKYRLKDKIVREHLGALQQTAAEIALAARDL